MNLQIDDEKITNVSKNKKLHPLFIAFLILFFPAGILYLNYRLNKYFMTKYPFAVKFQQTFIPQTKRFLGSSYSPGTYNWLRIHSK
jgi:hypothetical protein